MTEIYFIRYIWIVKQLIPMSNVYERKKEKRQNNYPTVSKLNE